MGMSTFFITELRLFYSLSLAFFAVIQKLRLNQWHQFIKGITESMMLLIDGLKYNVTRCLIDTLPEYLDLRIFLLKILCTKINPYWVMCLTRVGVSMYHRESSLTDFNA